MKTKTKIQRTMKQIPILTDFGLGLPHGTELSCMTRKMKEEKRRLLNSEERFESACAWLQGVEKTDDTNRRYDSYSLKHLVERRIGGHLSNGVLIAAAIHCGFSIKQARLYPNVLFNMSEDSILEKHQESLSYKKRPLEPNA